MRKNKTLSVWICGMKNDWMMFNNSEISVAGKLGGQDSFESIDSFESCDRLTQSWSSQSSFNSPTESSLLRQLRLGGLPHCTARTQTKGDLQRLRTGALGPQQGQTSHPGGCARWLHRSALPRIQSFTAHAHGLLNKPKWVRIQISTRQKASA